jgi:hypothetical protein
MSDYDCWKLSGPPEADELEIDRDCDKCEFSGLMTGWGTRETVTWECPECGEKYEASTADFLNHE